MMITLIGMAGGGKSTLGKVLARRLGYGFVDTDDLIEAVTGQPLQSLMDEKGDMALIDIEERCILSLELEDDFIIATGGSVIYSEKAMEYLGKISTIVFLDVPFATLQRRLSNLDSRGVVGLKDGNLYELYRERIPLYRKYADICVRIPGNEAVKKAVLRVMDSLPIDVPGHESKS